MENEFKRSLLKILIGSSNDEAIQVDESEYIEEIEAIMKLIDQHYVSKGKPSSSNHFEIKCLKCGSPLDRYPDDPISWMGITQLSLGCSNCRSIHALNIGKWTDEYQKAISEGTANVEGCKKALYEPFSLILTSRLLASHPTKEQVDQTMKMIANEWVNSIKLHRKNKD